jgi:hypothetical protein
VSLPPAHEAVCGVKVRAEHSGGSEKHGFRIEKWLAKPGDGRKIAKMARKIQFNTLNERSNGNPG